jgi:hypothetical protein
LFLKDKLYKNKKAIIFYKDPIIDCATSKNSLLLISKLVLSLNKSYRIAINKRELARLRKSFVNYFYVILKLYLILKINIASQIEVYNKLLI